MSQDNRAVIFLAIALPTAAGSMSAGCGLQCGQPPPSENPTDCDAVLQSYSYPCILHFIPIPLGNAEDPSQVYCRQIGGQLGVTSGEGGQVGLCVLPDGTEHDAWELYCADCGHPICG